MPWSSWLPSSSWSASSPLVHSPGSSPPAHRRYQEHRGLTAEFPYAALTVGAPKAHVIVGQRGPLPRGGTQDHGTHGRAVHGVGQDSLRTHTEPLDRDHARVPPPVPRLLCLRRRSP